MTKEEKKERLAYLRQLVDNTDPDTVKGHPLLARYSVRNAILILAQCPHATAVAGFHDWHKVGRSVRKGEKGIMILAPTTYRKEDQEEESLFFRTVYVFDVSQTEELSADSPRLARELVTA